MTNKIKSKENKVKQRLEYVKSAKQFGLNETCRIFGIAFDTVNKWVKRYEKLGLEGLHDQKRKKVVYSNEMPKDIERKIIRLKIDRPNIKLSEIKRELNLKYDPKIIKKKILNYEKGNITLSKNNFIDYYNLNRSSPKESNFFQYYSLDIKKNQISEQLSYIIIITDIITKFSYFSFAEDKTDIDISAFLHHFFSSLKNNSIEYKKIIIFPLKKYITALALKKNGSFIQDIGKKFAIRFDTITNNKIELLGLNHEPNMIKKDIFNFSSIDKNKILCNLILRQIDKNSKKIKTNKLKLNPNMFEFINSFYFLNNDNSFYNKIFGKKATKTISKYNLELIYKIIDLKLDNIENAKKEYNFTQCFIDLVDIHNIYKFTHIKDFFSTIKKVRIFQAEGDIYNYMGDRKKAVISYNKAIKLSKKINDKNLLLESNIKLSRIYYLENNEKALDILSDCRLLTENISFNIETKNKYDYYIVLADLYFNKLDFKEAYNYFEKASKLYSDHYYSAKRIMAIFGMTNVHIRLGEHNKAVSIVDELLDIAKKNNDIDLIAKMYIHAADLYINIVDFPFKYEKVVAEYIAKNNDYTEKIRAYEKLGLINIRKNEFTIANNYFKKGLLYAQKGGDVKLISIFYQNIANTFINQGKYSLAIKYLKKTLTISKKNKYSHLFLIANLNIGTLYLRKEKFEMSKKYFEAVLLSSNNKKYQSIHITTLANLAYVKYGLKNYIDSIEYIKKSITLSKKIKESFKLVKGYKLLGDCYKKLNNTVSCLKSYNNGIKIARDFENKSPLISLLKDKLELLQRSGKTSDVKKIESELKLLIKH